MRVPTHHSVTHVTGCVSDNLTGASVCSPQTKLPRQVPKCAERVVATCSRMGSILELFKETASFSASNLLVL